MKQTTLQYTSGLTTTKPTGYVKMRDAYTKRKKNCQSRTYL